MKENIQIQSHIYLNSDSLVSVSQEELLKKVSFLKKHLPLANSKEKNNHHFYYDKELFKKEILNSTSLVNMSKLPRDGGIIVTEHLLRSSVVTRLPGKRTKSMPITFFNNSIDHNMDIDEIEKNLEICNFPGFYLFLEPKEVKTLSILDIENFDNKIIEFNREYISYYLKRCSEVSKRLEKNKKIKKFRYDSKDSSSFPHIHFSVNRRTEVALNLIDLYFNENKFWKHDHIHGVEVPKNIHNILKERFKLPE